MDKTLNKDLLEILVCPVCKGNLVYKDPELICRTCDIKYPVKNGIPHMIPPK